jgi:hypothetical protein
MSQGRSSASGVRLLNGKVLTAGGVINLDGDFTNTAEIYDPTAGTWSSTGSMLVMRNELNLAMLPNGKVIAIGTQGSSNKTTELYDTATGVWSAGPSLTHGRSAFSSTVLPDGRILVVGTAEEVSTQAETASYTEYVVSSALKPTISVLKGSSSFPVNVQSGETVSVIGSNFTGGSIGTGDYGAYLSVSNQPHVYLRHIGAGVGSPSQNSDALIDVSTSVYNSPYTSSSLKFQIPTNIQSGYYLVSVVSNGVLSDAKVVNIPTTTPYRKRLQRVRIKEE